MVGSHQGGRGKDFITDYLRHSDGFSTGHMVGDGVHLDLKLLPGRKVSEGEGGGGASNGNWSAPRSWAGLAKGAVLDVVLRVQGGDRSLPAQAHSVILDCSNGEVSRWVGSDCLEASVRFRLETVAHRKHLNVISSARVEVSQRGSLVRCLDSSHLFSVVPRVDNNILFLF